MALLTPEYEKLIRREKIARLFLAWILLLLAVAAAAIIFMLPSYFYLALSKGEILRRLKASEEVLMKKNLKDIEEKIEGVNKILGEYERTEAMRRSFLPILIKIANVTPAQVRLKFLKLEKEGQSDKFFITLNGRAARREDFLDYFEQLKLLPEAEIVISPVTNLLKETDVVFSLNFKLKKEIYSYAP